MSDDLLPRMVAERFTAVDFALPAALGYRYAILDVDNTLAVTHGDLLPGVEAHLWQARTAGFLQGVCLVSNCMLGARRVERLRRLAEHLQVHWVAATWKAPKPAPRPFRQALQKMGCRADQVVVVGDQVYTDVRGGNRLGMYTVWVAPAGPDHWTTRLTLRRQREAWVLRDAGLWPQG